MKTVIGIKSRQAGVSEKRDFFRASRKTSEHSEIARSVGTGENSLSGGDGERKTPGFGTNNEKRGTRNALPWTGVKSLD